MASDLVEIVTRLGETIVDVVVVDRRELPRAIERLGFSRPEISEAPLVVRSRLGSLVATPVPRARRYVPRGPVEAGVIVCFALSLAAHVGLLVAASTHPPAERHARTGSPRARLVANHATAARARQDTQVVASLSDDDSSLAAAPAPTVAHAPAVDPTPADSAGERAGSDKASAAARHFDPCASGDCGLIASGPYETVTSGKHAGGEYQLPQREPNEVALSVVNCTVDGGCSTVSGTDQDDIRAEISRHVGDLHGCFGNAGGGAATVELQIDEGGEVHVTAKAGGEPADCLSRVIGKLALRGRSGDVTLAFTSD
jgi:hypothetical protein